MRDVLYLAYRYLVYHRFKTATLIGSIMLIVYLPIGLNVLIGESSRQLTTRATASPLLVGAKGSPLELVLRALYFEADVPADIHFSEVRRINRSEFATAIPIHARFHTRHSPIVGTSLMYFDYRQLRLAEGRMFGMLGECLLGAQAAQLAQVGPGDTILSSPESVFDIAGVYPLKMRVVGVLEPSGTPDDRAVFVDYKTAWVIAGLGHGHQDLSRSDAAENVLRQEGDHIVANASIVQYNEITPENVASFHFHGQQDEFPLTAILAVPNDEKSSTLLQGRYLGPDEVVQIVVPSSVMRELLDTVLTVQRYFLIAVGIIASATLATMALVFTLSLQLRRREMETMLKIGGSRARIAGLVAAEICSVLVVGVTLACLLSLPTYWLATSATQLLIQLS